MRTVSTLALAGAAAATARWTLRRSRRVDFEGASVVITGGSRGLGLELARRFAAEGARLALLARDTDELARAQKALAGVPVSLYPCDVTDAEAVNRTIERIAATLGGIDVLVNNAGVIQVGPAAHVTPQDIEEAMAVHMWGPLHTIRAAAPVMRGQPAGGRIVNVSSIGGLVAVPHLLAYSVSKFALTGLSDGLRAELAADGIRVTTVCPGLMRTGSHVQAWMKGRSEDEFAWFAAAASLPLVSMNAARAARRIVEACRVGQARLILTPQARLLYAAHTLLPSLTAAVMQAMVRALPGPAAAGGERRQKGWASTSRVAPSLLTRLGDNAARRNNELHGAAAAAYRRANGSTPADA